MTLQLPLGLELRSPTRLEDYVAGENQQLLQLLQEQFTSAGEAQLYVSGAPGSGRSHLLLGQCNAARDLGWTLAYLPCKEIDDLSADILQGLEQFQLIAIDDVDRLAGRGEWESALFGLFNRARERGSRLLFSAEHAAARAGFALPDLRTRLAWGITYRLKPLDDQQRQALLIQLSERRGLEMSDEVARYLLERHSRDIHRLLELIERLDHDSLAEQRRLTIPFVRTRLSA